MTDLRPANCRFRLADEGKAYPRSSCAACGKGITTGLGTSCTVSVQAAEIPEHVYGPVCDFFDCRPSEARAALAVLFKPKAP